MINLSQNIQSFSPKRFAGRELKNLVYLEMRNVTVNFHLASLGELKKLKTLLIFDNNDMQTYDYNHNGISAEECNVFKDLPNLKTLLLLRVDGIPTLNPNLTKLTLGLVEKTGQCQKRLMEQLKKLQQLTNLSLTAGYLDVKECDFLKSLPSLQVLRLSVMTNPKLKTIKPTNLTLIFLEHPLSYHSMEPIRLNPGLHPKLKSFYWDETYAVRRHLKLDKGRSITRHGVFPPCLKELAGIVAIKILSSDNSM